MSNKKPLIATICAIVLVIGAVFGGVALTKNMGKSKGDISQEASIKNLEKAMKNIKVLEGNPSKGMIEYDDDDNTAAELPDLKEDSIAVNHNKSGMYVEIFASSEKTGEGTDNYLREMAEEFNRSGAKLENGTAVSVQLRTVSSGNQIDYVASGKYVPDAISPSSKMQVDMLNAKGVDTEYIADSLVMNYAGVVMSSSTYSTLTEEYSGVNIKSLVNAVADNKFNMGYTNPFTSATGLNFLVSTLDTYSPKNILSETAISGFKDFQSNVAMVAMTTGQMKNAANKGNLDCFVSEYQTFINDPKLSKNYKFIPFGYEHENPLAAISSIDDTHKEALKLFADYCEANGESLAMTNGFNIKPDGYSYPSNKYTGNELIAAQKLYKEHKDTKPVICVFVADVSTSMDGTPIQELKNSLISTMKYINEDNYIGLVSYSDDVTIELPIDKFDLTQQSFFKGTVESLTPNGMTATFDGVLVAEHMIQEKLKEMPDAKCIIITLTDGEQNRGHSLKEVSDTISGLGVPIYSICYNLDLTQPMIDLANLNEGMYYKASENDLLLNLKNLFNANV